MVVTVSLFTIVVLPLLIIEDGVVVVIWKEEGWISIGLLQLIVIVGVDIVEDDPGGDCFTLIERGVVAVVEAIVVVATVVVNGVELANDDSTTTDGCFASQNVVTRTTLRTGLG